MDNSSSEHIRTIKDQAYRKGFMDGYRRGIEDGQSGAVQTNSDSGISDQPVQFLNLPKRAYNALDRAGFRRIREITALRREEIWKIRGLGSKGLHEIAWALWDNGIRDSAWNEWL